MASAHSGEDHTLATFSEDPEHFRVLAGCTRHGCVYTEIICTLCQAEPCTIHKACVAHREEMHMRHIERMAESGDHRHMCPAWVEAWKRVSANRLKAAA